MDRIWKKTGGLVSEEAYLSLRSRGSAEDDFEVPGAAPAGTPTQPSVETWRNVKTGGLVSNDARDRLLGNGQRPEDFEPADSAPAAAPPTSPDAGPDAAPNVASASEWRHLPTGALVSPAARDNLIARGAARADFRDAAEPPPRVSSRRTQ